jgi:hypothetical protein
MKTIYKETNPYDNTTIEYSIDLDGIKEEIKHLKTENSIPTILAYIYDLFQNWLIPEDIEIHLYEFVDPTDEYNDISEYWWNTYTRDNPLKQYCN